MSVLMMMMIQLAEYMTRTIPEIIIRFCRMVNISSIKINQRITVLVQLQGQFFHPECQLSLLVFMRHESRSISSSSVQYPWFETCDLPELLR